MKFKKCIKRAMDLVHTYTLEEVALLKLVMLVVGLLLAKLFPVLTTGNIWFYIVLIALGSFVLVRNMKWK